MHGNVASKYKLQVAGYSRSGTARDNKKTYMYQDKTWYIFATSNSS